MSFGHDDAYYGLDEVVRELIEALKKEVLSPQAQAALKSAERQAKAIRDDVEDMP